LDIPDEEYNIDDLILVLQEGLQELDITIQKTKDNKIMIKNIHNIQFNIEDTTILGYLGFDKEKYSGKFFYVSEVNINSDNAKLLLEGVSDKYFDIKMSNKFVDYNYIIEYSEQINTMNHIIVKIIPESGIYQSNTSHTIKLKIYQ
jgi:hypothetical protein